MTSIEVVADSVSVTVTITDDGRTVTGAGTVRGGACAVTVVRVPVRRFRRPLFETASGGRDDHIERREEER